MGGDGEGPGVGGGGGGVGAWKRLPETLEATLSLLSRLQAVMTRAWDPAEFSLAATAAATASAAEANSSATAAAAATAAAVGRASGSIASAWGVSGTPPVSEEEEEADDDEDDDDKDAAADTFVGSTRRARKWDWVRCSHAPVNPALAAGGGRGGGAFGGGNAQPVVVPVAIDPGFCHRTLRPGMPGPEGCTLEQVRWTGRDGGGWRVGQIGGKSLRWDRFGVSPACAGLDGEPGGLGRT